MTTPRAANVLAQAKINLFLRIGPADATGYHALATQFQRIDLADEVRVEIGGSGFILHCRGPFMPRGGFGPVEKNLAMRALTAFAQHIGWPTAATIHVTKNIPSGAGLGGGSADAGAVLRCLNALAPTPLAADALLDVARTLGADVPFLASEHASAIGTARGDRLTPIEPLPTRPLVLAVPDFPIATADAYRALDDAGGGTLPASSVMVERGDWEEMPGIAALRSWDEVAAGAHNDFEAVLDSLHPPLRSLREGLERAGALTARLAGSGSTVFGVFGEPPVARDLRLDALVISTSTSAHVVQVEVLE